MVFVQQIFGMFVSVSSFRNTGSSHFVENFSKGLMCLSTSGKSKFLLDSEFFSTVPGKNFDLCIISTRTKTHNPLEKFTLYLTTGWLLYIK